MDGGVTGKGECRARRSSLAAWSWKWRDGLTPRPLTSGCRVLRGLCAGGLLGRTAGTGWGEAGREVRQAGPGGRRPASRARGVVLSTAARPSAPRCVARAAHSAGACATCPWLLLTLMTLPTHHAFSTRLRSKRVIKTGLTCSFVLFKV